jgi:uncharacterized protein (TIGR03118 family)
MRNDTRFSRRRSKAYMLCLESLEDRCLLSGNVLQTNLVSDLPGVAKATDPNLVNPWGITSSPTGPLWISDNHSGVSTVYNTPGLPQAPVVSIPATGGSAGGTVAPTGAVFNIALGNNGFMITDGTHTAPAIFLFATTAGTLAGWNPGVDPTGKFDGPGGISASAVVAVDNSASSDAGVGEVYKGLAIATDANNRTLLYATNFALGRIDVFDTSFHAVTSLPEDAFTDWKLPQGYAPFNIEAIGGQIYVTYARSDYVAGPGHGFIDVYDLDGSGGHRLISGGPLDLPWGLTLAPTGFGSFGGDLLVGNFGNGLINAFDPQSGKYLGTLTDPDGEAIQIDGLYALQVGNGYKGGDADTVYFTAGIDHDSHGLFGSLTAGEYGSDTTGPETYGPYNTTASPDTSSYLDGSYAGQTYPGSTGDSYSASSQATYEAMSYPTSQVGADARYEYQVSQGAMPPALAVEPTAAPKASDLANAAPSRASISGRPGEASTLIVAGHLAPRPALVAAHDARSSLDGALSDSEQIQTALENGFDKIVEQSAGSPGTSTDPIQSAPQSGSLLGGALTIDLGHLKGAVDHFFARLDELAENMSPETQRLVQWLLAGATATGMFEFVRRRTRQPMCLAKGDPDDSIWVPYPVLEPISKRGQGL